MRILGIDHGSRRIGLALSDETATIALAIEQFEAEPVETIVEKITGVVTERGVGMVVVGMPRNMDGSYGPQARKVLEFVTNLRAKVSVPVKTWDERLTTVAAERVMLESDLSRTKRKRLRDKIAAQIMLQGYLDARAQRDVESFNG